MFVFQTNGANAIFATHYCICCLMVKARVLRTRNEDSISSKYNFKKFNLLNIISCVHRLNRKLFGCQSNDTNAIFVTHMCLYSEMIITNFS
jgi:hypothetical protein